MIEKFSFGEIVINGKKYYSDVIVFWDGEIVEREKNHIISQREIEEIFLKGPEVVVIGKGTAGMVRIDEKCKKIAKEEGIELMEMKTEDAVKFFNRLLAERKKVAGIFHLTC